MLKEELLKKHRKNVQNLRDCAKELNLSDKEIDEMFRSCYKILKRHVEFKKNNDNRAQKLLVKSTKVFFIFIATLLIIYVLLNVHQPTSSIVLRNVQGFIYPGLKIVRYLSVPIIKRFPSLTEFYDETCLLENPYFYVQNMECWPCENVHSVIDLTGFDNYSLYQSGIPYLVKTEQQEIAFQHVQQLYMNYSEIFDADSSSIKSDNKSLVKISDILNFTFDDISSSTTHISWRINRMNPSRRIRILFPRPYIITEWSGQSVERFIFMDGKESPPYAFPNTECSYVFVIQGSGERTIVLKPSRECTQKCHTVSVVLKPSYVLWYNWWYWRPISLPVQNATENSVTYLNSYC